MSWHRGQGVWFAAFALLGWANFTLKRGSQISCEIAILATLTFFFFRGLEEFIVASCTASYKLQPSRGVPHNAGREPSPRGIADIAPGDADLCGAASCCADAVGCGEG